MTRQCERGGCEKEAISMLRFTDAVHRFVDTDNPVALCQEHTSEVKRFLGTDVAGVKEWIKS